MLTCEITGLILPDGKGMSEYITDYTITLSEKDPTSDGGFQNWDGTYIMPDGTVSEGKQIVTDISMTLAKVPRASASAIADAVHPSDRKYVNLTYANPSQSSANFLLNSYSADSRRFGDTWDISLSFTTDGVSTSSGGGL